MNEEKVYLVWSVFNGMPFPQKSYDIKTDGAGKEKQYEMKPILLKPDEVQMSLNILAIKYPYQRKEENV